MVMLGKFAAILHGNHESSQQPNKWKADSGGDSPRFKRSFIRGLPPQDERSGKKIVNGLPISGYRNGDQT